MRWLRGDGSSAVGDSNGHLRLATRQSKADGSIGCFDIERVMELALLGSEKIDVGE